MATDVIAGSVNIFGWGFKPLLEKKGVSFSNPFIFANIRYFITALVSIVLLILFSGKFNEEGTFLQTLDYNTIKYGIIVSCVGLMAIYSNYYLLSKYDASYVIGIVEPGVLITTLVLGHYFFNEQINSQRILGIIIVCIGIYVIYLSK